MNNLEEEKPGMHRWARPKLFGFAKRNRRPMTAAEQKLWEALSGRKLGGHKFRRQHPCGSYVLDFYCHKGQLCVEIDGAYHLSPEQHHADEARDAYLNEQGIRVLRFPNESVLEDLPGVLKEIESVLNGGH